MFYSSSFQPGTLPGAASIEDEGLIASAGLGRLGPALNQALEAHACDVRPFARISTGCRELERVRPDTMLVGLDEGWEAAEAILAKARGIEVPIILALIDSVDTEGMERALRAGAHDVVIPPHSAPSVLVRRRVIRRLVHDGSNGGFGQHVHLGSLTVNLSTRQVQAGDEPLRLSGREFELLLRLMEARGSVVSRERLLADIWGDDQGSDAVLDATVHRLRKRLDERRLGLDSTGVTTVRGVGYRLETRSHAPGIEA